MRSFVIMAMFAASLSSAAWNDYTEDRDLELDTKGINTLEIDAGAGSLAIRGNADTRNIRVKATISVPDESAEKAKEIIASDMTLSLEKVRDRARLEAYFDHKSWGWDDPPSVDLEIRVPHSLALVIDDASGSLQVMNVDADVTIEDGSGSIKVEQVGSVVIDDGSGSIEVTGVRGDVSIEDGSGSITVRKVGGSVIIDDGSGGINVDDVEHDLTIVDDGSGSLDATDIRGTIKQDT
ncbi:MAG: DUF4097 domain-containing protein [Gammaproteobacteria bacterium]|nr:DUF4097 domain-containing protein [Gammaproteobacteria bacterium]MDH3749427.1 DUF4097 domain-containing protein [Gammaproteobacteria bacterium]MDH3805971.1 DUF4097 domain-containing protein [Gammaproteobacteria bacterium]